MGVLNPPADFSEWPATRIGALIIDALALTLLFAMVAIAPLRKKVLCASVCYTNLCCLIFVVVLAGVLGGMWCHFIPCIWWTCDWGANDGEGVRGAIWFISGILLALIASIALCLKRYSKREPPLQNDSEP
mmetsp:Transcript_22014/g.47405  ORF Transcript_22014/g.47405 Transcript_22014/m.47405 type:complete len:131 (-) Transcript_22014:410-802(-)